MPRSVAAFSVVALLLFACDIDSERGGPPPATGAVVELPITASRPLPACDRAEVIGITDGDTVRVRIDGREERLRYIGIDAPELRPQSGPPEPFAAAASDANASLVLGLRVCLESDISDRDQFGRLLRYAWLEDGRMVNEILVAAGLAEAKRYRPDVRHHESILAPAQQAADADDRGIWSK